MTTLKFAKKKDFIITQVGTSKGNFVKIQKTKGSKKRDLSAQDIVDSIIKKEVTI